MLTKTEKWRDLMALILTKRGGRLVNEIAPDRMHAFSAGGASQMAV
ncbi:MAG: hypothetical protein HRU72_15390 [Planctomycetia bacterium]|nr:MAG: hypothetical protein HRU72_15390 [Planctomycetia bacterium]HQU32508.1 hypothetical protein [Candidatus Brocadia sapporoensis]